MSGNKMLYVVYDPNGDLMCIVGAKSIPIARKKIARLDEKNADEIYEFNFERFSYDERSEIYWRL